MAPLGVSFHLLIEDPALVLSALLVPFDSNWVYVVALGYVILSKVVPCPFPSCYTVVNTYNICYQLLKIDAVASLNSQVF